MKKLLAVVMTTVFLAGAGWAMAEDATPVASPATKAMKAKKHSGKTVKKMKKKKAAKAKPVVTPAK